MSEIHKKTRGFTLIELIIVIVIIVVLLSLASASLMTVRKKSRDMTRVVHIGQIQSALAAYHRDTGSYPEKITPGEAFILGNVTYMKQVPNSPLPVESPCDLQPEYTYSTQGNNSYALQFCLTTEVNGMYSLESATPAGIVGIGN